MHVEDKLDETITRRSTDDDKALIRANRSIQVGVCSAGKKQLKQTVCVTE